MTAFLLCVLAIALLYFVRTCRDVGIKHQKTDWGKNWLNALDGLNRLFCWRYHRLSPEFLDLPESGGAIVASNHLSGLDALLLIAAAKRPLRFMIAHEQYNRFGLKWLLSAVGCIPVDRTGRSHRALREALRAWNNGEVVAIFPQGGIHWPLQPNRKLKRGVATLSQKTGCPIYPVFIDGIALKGHTVLSVPVRSYARLFFYEPIQCKPDHDDQCLRHLAQILNQHKR